MVAGEHRGAPRPARLPRRPGPAGRGLRGDGSLECRRALRPGPRGPIPTATCRPRRSRACSGWSRAGSRPGRCATCARVAWDRVHNRLAALPGSARLALVGGGTIPDTGQYPVFLGEDGPRLGELDEEFVFERRVGETFALGNNTWRIEAIEAHRVVVGPRRAERGDALLARRGDAALARAGRGRRRALPRDRRPRSTIPGCPPGSRRSAGSSRGPHGS